MEEKEKQEIANKQCLLDTNSKDQNIKDGRMDRHLDGWLENSIHCYKHSLCAVQWTLVKTTAFVPKDVTIKMNLLLYRIFNEQIDT